MTVTRLSPDQAYELMLAGYIYIDVRTPEEFEDGRPRGAISVPYSHNGPDGMVPNAAFVEQLQAALRTLGATVPKIVLGCRSGGRSMRAAALLQAAGFSELYELRTGWDGSRDAFGALLEPGWSRTALPRDE
jgi:rhodanese-related sulfurtransferase